MIEDEAPCLEVAQQLHAVVKALENAKGVYVQDHIEHCIDGGMGADKPQLTALLNDLKEVSKYL